MRTLIHIGLPRTASTFFQRQVFSKFQGFDFLGVEHTFYSDSFQKLLYQDNSLYKSLNREELTQSNSENILLSNELFCGQSFAVNATNRTRTAERLKSVFPEAEIVIVLRNQLSLLQSLYAMAVYSGYYEKPEDFVNFGEPPPRYHTFSENEHAETYLLSPLIELYCQLFNRVHIFLFEDFRSNPNAFFEKMISELGVELRGDVKHEKKENKSLSERQIRYFRRINRAKPLLEWSSAGKGIFRQKLWFGEHIVGGKKKFRFSDDLAERILNYYRSDNRYLFNNLNEIKGSANFEQHYLH